MKKTIATLALILLAIATQAASSALGTWNAYMAYTDITKVVKGGNMVYALASKGLYSYTSSDQSIATYDKVNTLNDCDITDIAWNADAQRLLVVYENYNMDLLSPNGDVVNLSDYYSKTMTSDKTLADIHMNGIYAYIATGFGVIKVDMQNAAIADTYNLGLKTNSVTLSGNYIYAATTAGVYRALLTDNLADKANWKAFCYKGITHIYAIGSQLYGINNGDACTIDANGNHNTFFRTWFTRGAVLCSDRIICYGVSYTDIIRSATDYQRVQTQMDAACYDPTDGTYWIGQTDGTLANADIASDGTLTYKTSQIKPDGPEYNYFGFMRYANGKLYTSGANGASSRPACVQVYKGDGEWQVYDDDFASTLDHKYQGALCLDVDPSDDSHVFMGSQTGLYEFRNGQLANHWNMDNSPLQPAATVGESSYRNYTLVTSVRYDNSGHLWLANSISSTTSLFELSDNTWTSHHHSELMNSQGYSLETMKNIMFDSQRDCMWLCSSDWRKPALICYQPSTDGITLYNNFINQDGTSFTAIYVNAAAEDSDGNIWIGTGAGPFMLEASTISSGDNYFTQVKVPRNDGTNYADYLLSGVSITAIAIDGAGRKWFGTEESGVFLISADNLTQEQHFTAENSPLLSNAIESIAINPTTGEVFFGTASGLCSYMSNASQPNEEMTKDNVYAYPNPVKPDYTGLITVTGLTLDADVKITTSNGVLVTEGRSNGGTFTWDGCDSKGRRVASGVYMVQTATSDGKKGTVCKIAVIN